MYLLTYLLTILLYISLQLPRLPRKFVYVIVGSVLLLLIYSLSNFGERIDPRRRTHNHLPRVNDDDVVVMTHVTTPTRTPTGEKEKVRHVIMQIIVILQTSMIMQIVVIDYLSIIYS